MRSYLGIRHQGTVYTLSTFNLNGLLESYGGHLPPFVYQYHFDKLNSGEVDRSTARWKKYDSFPKCTHGDGSSLGAFNIGAIKDMIDMSQPIKVGDDEFIMAYED